MGIQLWAGGTPAVSISIEIIYGILIALGYLMTPVALIRGWARWTRQPKQCTALAIFSLIGFLFATASSILAVGSVAYAQVHHFPYYDPLLLKIFRWGCLLSLAGIVFGIVGVWRPGSLRWHAPLCGIGMLAFWVLAAEGE
jgi:hypothetical protein